MAAYQRAKRVEIWACSCSRPVYRGCVSLYCISVRIRLELLFLACILYFTQLNKICARSQTKCCLPGNVSRETLLKYSDLYNWTTAGTLA